ncbi:MAG: universal stress protein [Anaerolineales bacterium]|nr:universal stress protein [Anaerolineales bacterium]
MYKTILVPLDGSTRAEKILPYVEEIARCMDSTLIVMQVLEAQMSFTGMEMAQQEAAFEAYKHELHSAETYIAQIQADLYAKGLHCQARVEHGTVVQSIIRVSRQTNTDLIAMASHGRTGLGRVFYGSVAAGVLHQADRPLLLIRSEGEA